MSSTLRGIVLMTVAMAAFAVEDALIKLATGSLPPGQVLMMLGVAGAPVFAALARAQGHRVLTRALLSPALLARNAAEMVGTVGFVTALALIPLSTASAILQAAPLLVTAGAAVFLGQAVGWRRWAAVVAGFAGVMLILRPGMDGFDANALWAVLGVTGLAARDLITGRMPPALPTHVVAATAFAAVSIAGGLMLAVSGGARLPPPVAAAQLGGALAIGIAAYWAIVEATRSGDAAAIAPFRYTRMVFALVVAWLIFAEVPDAPTLAGAALIVASGLYTLYRERLRRLDRRGSGIVSANITPEPEARP
ncbi:MAG: DMT family transporter [Paracoccaceae bacterium]|nr:MAG: DMT family transporter [Paracoccaceae bacterium]